LSKATAIEGETHNSITYKTSDEGVIYIYCVATGLGGSVRSNTIKVTVSGVGEPIFTTNLNTLYEVSSGVSFTLSVDAGDRPTYQWYHNTVSSTEGATPIVGATSKSYTYTTPVGDAADDPEFYYCVATNTVGAVEYSTTSKIARVKYVSQDKLIDWKADGNIPEAGDEDLAGITIHGTTVYEKRNNLGCIRLANGYTSNSAYSGNSIELKYMFLLYTSKIPILRN
jgi:hypothetical protein